jgi:L-lactate dehydrogenase (cytochrome)
VTIASISDFRLAARRRLPKFLFEYIDGGSYAEATLRRNVDDLASIALRQRVLRDVSKVSTATELFGQKLAMPVMLGPVGLAGMYARRGEVQAARAAESAGIPFCLSTVSACPFDEVRRAVKRPFWFQLYVIRDRAFMRDLLAHVAEGGCNTLVFTVDMAMAGARYRDRRSGLHTPSQTAGALRRVAQAMVRPHWAWDVGLLGRPHSLGNVTAVLKGKSGLEDFFGWLAANFDPSVTWDDLGWIREIWKGPMIIKGIMDPEDALQAVKLGVQGVVVSNHGGRQLDGVVSTARALPAIADAVGDRLTVLADGGVRSGLDVLRMLALGAKGVLLGRAWAFALAAGGEAGVRRMLDIVRNEMLVAMSLTGVTELSRIDRSILDTSGSVV